MPTFSIVVTAYNNCEYLPACLQSIADQTLADWECVVVNDASPDSTSAVAHRFADADDRFKVLDLEKNSGLHLARRAGLAACSGDYVIFLDADDDFAAEGLSQLADALESRPADIAHFGIKVVADGAEEEACAAFEENVNGALEDVDREGLLRSVFAEDGGYVQDWRVTQRAYRLAVAQAAFDAMTDSRLERAEDCYEFLVLADKCEGEVTVNDVRLLNYHFGRGVTGTSKIDAETFSGFCSQFRACMDAADRYAAEAGLVPYAEGAKSKLLDLLMNDWLVRVGAGDKAGAAKAAAEVLGAGAIAAQLMRLSRDDAYARLVSGRAVGPASDCVVWRKLALELAQGAPSDALSRYKADADRHIIAALLGSETNDARVDEAVDLFGAEAVALELMRLARDGAYEALKSLSSVDEDSACFRLFARGEALIGRLADGPSVELRSLRDAARGHLFDLERAAGFASSTASDAPTLSMRSAYEAEDVRIFVTTHKNVDLFHSAVLQPVQVGARSPRRRLLWAYQDDAGNSISDQNAMYCELTTQYWAWKNADAKYYGFCHYRRYFDFSDVEHEENAYGEVMDEAIDWESRSRYSLDDDSIRSAVDGYDVVTTGIKDLHDFPERYKSPYDHYARAPYLKIADLDRVIGILKEMHPDYAADADAYLAGHLTCFCNMYVMRKELFFRYCEWMFPILERFVDGWDTSLLSHETLRTPGHLSERLFNIWLTHEKRVNPSLRHKQVQCVHFEKPDHAPEPRLEPVDGHGKPVVPVVFAADNNYVPMVTTTAYSMLKNASSDRFYDVVILEKDFTAYNKRLMSEFFARFDNASVRFVNVAGMVQAYNLQTSNEHISVETYYRFLIQKVLPGYDKVLYLDSDLIVEGDVAELYATEMGDNLIAAARDIDYLGNLNMNDGERIKYTNEVLGLANPYDYFQAGVLVLNTAEMRKLYPFQKWLEIAAEPKYIYDDQDILNAHCDGRVVYLDNAWNVMNDCGGRIKKVFSFAPADVYDKFMAAYAAPKIIHYAGFEKPWKPGPCDLGEIYWMYARETPFYERFVSMKYPNRVEVDQQVGHSVGDLEYRLTTPERAISEDSPLRQVFDGALPQGSQRREAAKAVVRKLRGRK